MLTGSPCEKDLKISGTNRSSAQSPPPITLPERAVANAVLLNICFSFDLKKVFLKRKLAFVEYANADIIDHSVNMVKTAGLLEKRRSERDLRILNEMYIEIMKQLEIMNFKLLDKKSAIHVLSSPRYPLVSKKPSLIVSVIIGSFLGFVLSASFVLMKHRYKSAMAKIKGANETPQITT